MIVGVYTVGIEYNQRCVSIGGSFLCRSEGNYTLIWKGNYSSFLLRFRQMQNDGDPTWVISIQSTKTGQKWCFSSLDGLIQFLEREYGNDTELDSANDLDTMKTPDSKLP